MVKKRPSFRKPRGSQAYETPEELFGKLPNRTATHGYLRAPQVDALRSYLKCLDEPNVAFELPTGTGKTLAGLLIAEWRRRRSGNKVAYLTLTNQLATQVLEEASKLGIECADLIGTKSTRKAAEEGRYRSAQAIGITTYSNLFNVKPVIQSSEVLVFDDAHGGEHYVADMWTVQISNKELPDYYAQAVTEIRPALTDSQYRSIQDESQWGTVELADVAAQSEIMSQLTALIDTIEIPAIHFPWSMIRKNLSSCLILVSPSDVYIRPVVPPTHIHAPFNETTQRIYMSATLGGEGDLLRSYGITSIKTIRAQHPQWGKRYIFTPGLYLEEEESKQLIAEVWKKMSLRRVLLLAPSFLTSRTTFSTLADMMTPKPTRLEARDIEDSLSPFTRTEDVMLCLAGRYDGLDLPGDDCRLLLIAESPGNVGALERYQREHWKLGPLLRRRERTRLIQGVGRCTRDATDFAVIILLGQSLTNSITTPAVTDGLPSEIQRELSWGIAQGEVAREQIADLVEMVLGLLNDSDYRKDANESLEDTDFPEVVPDPKSYDDAAKLEVQFNRAFWQNDYTHAYEIARHAVDQITDPELTGYRAWWFYLGSLASHFLDELESELDCLRRARATGVNSGYLDYLLRKRSSNTIVEQVGDVLDLQAEAIWDRIVQWGWQGPKFARAIKEMKECLVNISEPSKYHIGLERVGECLGADAVRSTEDGAPDVVWFFPDRCYTFEAKSDKKPDGSIFKKDVLQAIGHTNWALSKRNDVEKETIRPVIVSPTQKIDQIAKPHVMGLNYVSLEQFSKFSDSVAYGIMKIRTEFAGKEYGAVVGEFKVRVKQLDLHLDAISNLLEIPLQGN